MRSASVAMSLTGEEVKDFKEGCQVFEKEKGAGIEKGELGTLLRSCGQNPSDADVEEITAKVAKGDMVDEAGVLEAAKIMKGKMSNNTEAATAEAFKAFDKDNNGMVSAA